MGKRSRVIILGIMGRTPFAGVAWQALHYVEGFRRLASTFTTSRIAANGRTIPSRILSAMTAHTLSITSAGS